MKRIVIAGSVAFAITILVILLLAFANESKAPKFVSGAPATNAHWGSAWYPWTDDVPFQNGRAFFLVADSNNVVNHVYLYDLNQSAILGELVNFYLPLLQNRDGSRLLVGGPPPGLVSAYRTALAGAGKIFPSLGAAASRVPDSLWVVETRNNSARRVLTGVFPGRWHSSPDFRYGYCISDGKLRLLCDLESERVSQLSVAGDPIGWWDSHTILAEVATNSLGLFDVQTSQSRTLLSAPQIHAFLATNDLPDDMFGVRAFANWNGRDYDFYLGRGSQMPSGPRYEMLRPTSGTSFLLKIDRNGPSLKLLYREFKFQPEGVLDAGGTRYLYEGARLDGEIFLRDLQNDKLTTLVLPDKTGAYTRPRFFGDEVIYFRRRQIRRVKLDGTGDKPLLP